MKVRKIKSNNDLIGMNKKIILGVMIFLLFFFWVVFRSSYAIDSYNREELQDVVVSTALSYYHNKTYSDYGQTPMDNESSFNWRTFNQSPEMVSRASYYYIDCSSFVGSVYIHSLGYDFSEYYEYSATSSKYFNNFETLLAKESKENYINAYKYNNRGLSTYYYTAIGQNEEDSDIVVYHYVVNDDAEEQVDYIFDNKILEPGDILVYRVDKDDDDKADSGHAMLYVGDAIDSDNGFIHSTGTDYKISDDEEVTVGNDSYSVRYDDAKEKLYDTVTSRDIISFTVLRPINRFCNEDDECFVDNLSENAAARVDLSKLRVEQYAKISKEYSNSSQETEVIEKSLSKYNSVNNGDTIQYRLYLLNRSKMQFCVAGKYNSQSTCEDNGYEWKTSDNGEVTFDGLKVIGKIPENTEFVSCNYEDYCTYDEANNTVTWNVHSIAPGIERTYSYEVKVTGDVNIENEGMEIITNEGNVLKLSSLETKVNFTINDENINLLVSEVEKFETLNESKNIIYNSSSSADYTKDLDLIKETEEINLSQLGFIKSIYYNSLDFDLGYLNATNIKNAIFNYQDYDDDGDYDYVKKTDADVVKLTNENYININKMLVKGMYGGRYLLGNDNKDRAQFMRLADLEFGDIVIFFYGDDSQNMSSYMFYGLDSDGQARFVRFESKNGVTLYDASSDKTGWKLFKELYSKNLFVILRPTQLYDTTVDQDYKLELDSSLDVDKNSKIIKYLSVDTIASEVLNKVSVSDSNASVILYDKNGNKKNSSDKVASGDILTGYVNNTKFDGYILSVLGDANGDGDVGLIDLVQMRRHIVKWVHPQTGNVETKMGAYYYAIDMNKDGDISLIDLVRIRRFIVNAGLEG